MSYSEVFCDGKDHNGDPIIFGDDLSKKLFVEKCGGKYEEDLYTTGMCSNFDQSNSVCLQFHQQVGFQNLWIGFLILIAFCLLLCAFYSFFMCCKFSHLKHVIKWHIGIFLVNITIWFWVPSLIFNAICQTHLVCGWYVFAIPLVAGCFIATLLDLHFSPEARYFRTQKQAEETHKFLERIRAAKPAIGVKIECFHYETRMRRNSNSFRARTVKKVTQRERRLFPIDGFVDVSQVPSIIGRGGVTLFHISKSITPGDAYSQDTFLQFKNRYIAANSHRDQSIGFSIEVSIPELSDTRVMTFSGSPHWWASKYCFYVLSFLHMSIILRILFRTRSTVFSILIEKKYFADPNIQRSYDFDTGLVGPSVVNNFIMSPQQGFGPAQYSQPGGIQVQVPSQFDHPGGRQAQVPSQFRQPGGRQVQVPSQFGQPGGRQVQVPSHFGQPGGIHDQVPSQFDQPGGSQVQVPSQFGQSGERQVLVPSQFGQPGFAEERQDHQAFIRHETKADDLPPTYEEHYKFKEIS